MLVWDSGQPIIEVGVGNKLSLAVVDSGAHMTVASTSLAAALGLQPAPPAHCGHYSVAGGQLLAYAGYVPGPVQISFGDGVTFRISGLRLVEHQHPLLLLVMAAL